MPVGDSFRFAVAPMMEWTDRHCRYFHRLMSRRALLYTEMVSSAALVRGNASASLDHHPCEHPVALQLGGSDPDELAEATRMGEAAGFDEVNLNAGCPSDRVQKGCFGAVLMTRPELVGRCLESMIRTSKNMEVTVKCRIGVDEQSPETALPAFLDMLANTGVRRVAIHARKAWLSGLSPKQNRNIPPLDHDLVIAMKNRYPQMRICLNGGIADLDAAERCLGSGIDGVMLGRAAYRTPCSILMEVDQRIFGNGKQMPRSWIAERMFAYIEQEVRKGTRTSQITRHMIGLYSGYPGAKAWRQALSDSRRIEAEGTGHLAEMVKKMSETELIAAL